MSARSVHAELIYTGESVVRDSFLVFNGKKLGGISERKQGELAGECAVLTPAFLDPHCHIGIWRAAEPLAECEISSRLAPVVSLAWALDSVQMDDAAFAASIRAGVLYSWVLPGSANVLGGRGAIIRNYAASTSEALIARRGVKGAFGYNPISRPDWAGARPQTRMGALSILRSTLSAVRRKLDRLKKLRGRRREEVEFSAEEEVLRRLLERRETFIAHAHKPDDIAALLRLADEFGLRLSLQHAIAVDDPRVYEELKRRGVPVVHGPIDFHPYKVELKSMDPRNVRLLVESGVDYGLMTDHPITLQDTMLLALRWFLRAGLGKQECVELVTRRNARIMGLERQLGTLGRGKWASFTCWNGDPFDLASRPVAVYGEGQLLYSESEGA